MHHKSQANTAIVQEAVKKMSNHVGVEKRLPDQRTVEIVDFTGNNRGQ